MKTQSTSTYHLQIGDIIICKEPATISTILGSCVSVCLYSKSAGAGGMVHYAHPCMLSEYGQSRDFRYGEVAIPTLIEELEKVSGDLSKEFVAKIVGGARIHDEVNSNYEIGVENIKIAHKILKKYYIQIVGEDTGGTLGRKVLFHVATNRLQVAQIYPKDQPVKSVPKTSDRVLNNPIQVQNTSRQISSQKRRVLIVDDSKVIRKILRKILLEDPDLEVVGSASDAYEAEKLLSNMRPDVITLDINMKGMSGVEWLEKLLPRNPIPVVMISSLRFQEGNEVFRALEIGAVDYIQKPNLSEVSNAGATIREKVKAASYAKIIHAEKKISNQRRPINSDIDLRKVVAIGASTGGTEALKVVMAGLPEQIPPMVVVQHIPAVFSKAFADRLNDICPFEVKEAEDGDELRVSRVLIAPGGKQMKVQQSSKGYCVRIMDDPPMNRHKPSVDYLFQSVAAVMGKNCVGVILTGMGSDGAKGLLEMKNRGSKTIAQDENSCVVYGMPKTAVELGAVEKSVPISEIAHEILVVLGNKRRE